MTQNAFPQQQGELRACPYCHGLFTPKRARQDFCRTRCRKAFHDDIGIEGRVVSNRKIKSGQSIVIHITGPSAVRGQDVDLSEIVSIVRQPR